MLKRLPIAISQIKTCKTSENLGKLYILCVKQKKLLKKVWNNIMNSIKL